MDMQAITDKYYELTNAICDVEVTVVGEDGVERRAAYGDLLVNGTVVMCGDSMYAYRNKYEYGPLDGWWDNIDDGNQANVYQVLYWYLGAVSETLSVLFASRRSATNSSARVEPQLSK